MSFEIAKNYLQKIGYEDKINSEISASEKQSAVMQDI